MPNQVTAAGLTVKTIDEIVTFLTDALKAIYGDDINVDPDSPDGQWINTIAQMAVDNLELQVQIYNSFDPDQAPGVILDQRVALNGLMRLGGTFTITPVTVVTDRALSLAGLDAEVDNPDGTGFTVQDDEGNQFILVDSEVIPSAGSYSLAFRAKNPGAVETVPNTITTPVTIVLGVVSVNNPLTYTTLGINQETDAALRIRRQRSVAISSIGYLQGLLAALLNINEVTSAFVYENNTGAADGDGVPGHSIWVIVEGGSDEDVAQVIYSKRNAGCGMKGDEEVVITQIDGSPFVIKFDRVENEDLYIEFDAESIDGVGTIDAGYIADQLVIRLVPGVYDRVNVNELATIVQEIDPNCLVTNAGFSTSGGGPFTTTLQPTSKNQRFVLDAANINITVI